jgi:hypothetical protein
VRSKLKTESAWSGNTVTRPGAFCFLTVRTELEKTLQATLSVGASSEIFTETGLNKNTVRMIPSIAKAAVG